MKAPLYFAALATLLFIFACAESVQAQQVKKSKTILQEKDSNRRVILEIRETEFNDNTTSRTTTETEWHSDQIDTIKRRRDITKYSNGRSMVFEWHNALNGTKTYQRILVRNEKDEKISEVIDKWDDEGTLISKQEWDPKTNDYVQVFPSDKSSASSNESDKRPTSKEDRVIPLGIAGKKKLEASVPIVSDPSALERVKAKFPALANGVGGKLITRKTDEQGRVTLEGYDLEGRFNSVTKWYSYHPNGKVSIQGINIELNGEKFSGTDSYNEFGASSSYEYAHYRGETLIEYEQVRYTFQGGVRKVLSHEKKP